MGNDIPGSSGPAPFDQYVPAKPPNGRKSRLTPFVAQVLLASLRSGDFIVTACVMAGVTAKTFENWHRRAGAEDADPALVRFVRACEEATSLAEHDALQNIVRAGDDGDWRASAWYLARRAPKRYGERKDVNVTSETTKRVIIEGLDLAQARVMPGIAAHESVEAPLSRPRLPHAEIEVEGVQVDTSDPPGQSTLAAGPQGDAVTHPEVEGEDSTPSETP